MNKNMKAYQRLAEDAAYSSKGLHKTADWAHAMYSLYLVIPLVFSVVSLGFSSYLSPFVLSGLSVVSLVGSVFALVNQKSLETIKAYRTLAGDFKAVYDRLELAWLGEGDLELQGVAKQLELLRVRTAELPISPMGRWWSKWKINNEMNLSWIYEQLPE